MRKSILGALIGSAFALGPAQAALMLDLNGSAGGGLITATALDWSPTSFLAQGGNSAISSFAAGTCAVISCSFDVLTHAKLTGYKPVGVNSFSGLPAFGGEITMVAKYTETVTAFTPGASPSAQFRSTGAGWVEFYYSTTEDSDEITGSGYNNGRLIGRLNGVSTNVLGSFTVDGLLGPTNLDCSNAADPSITCADADDRYPGQLTVQGSGSQATLAAGLVSKVLDPTFFLTSITGFALNYTNISIGLPYVSSHPSDCFNPTMAAAAVGTSGLSSTCNTTHVLGPYAAQNPLDPGYLPVVGPINGLDLGSPDFVAQTDFNSSVNGVPEPGSLALVGLALSALGFAARRRRA